jgi:hypothetical protein
VKACLVFFAFYLVSIPLFGQEAKSQFYGVNPDCSEIPLSTNDLIKIANSEKVVNIEDFLKNLPKGTLQGFTLVHNSLSAQQGRNSKTSVRPEWPRVLRSSVDGKVTIAYTCDPNSETYNKIEVLHFDDTNSLKAISIDLKKQSGIGENLRVHQNPQTCTGCHTNTSRSPINGELSLKHIWPAYPQWADCDPTRSISVYGSNDDNMGIYYRRESVDPKFPGDCTPERFEQAHKKELEDWKSFRDLQKDNPCYALLPWPESDQKIPVEYSVYPYSYKNPATNSKYDQGLLRTNHRFTQRYAHLLAKRNAALIQAAPGYDRVKYLITMEALGCDLDRESARKLLNLQVTQGIFDAFSQKIGLKPEEWSLEFRTEGHGYNAALPGQSGDSNIHSYTQGELLMGLSAGDPEMELLTKDALAPGYSKAYGEKFKCLDQLGGEIKKSLYGRDKPLCALLKKRFESQKSEAGHCTDCVAKESKSSSFMKYLKDLANSLIAQ